VSIPTNLERTPTAERASICRVMPSFVSVNHQAEPICIFPGTVPSWKHPRMEGIMSLSLGFSEYTIVFPSFPVLSSLSRRRERCRPCSKSPMASYPVSGPRRAIIRELLFRMAPRWSCCVHPWEASMERSS